MDSEGHDDTQAPTSRHPRLRRWIRLNWLFVAVLAVRLIAPAPDTTWGIRAYWMGVAFLVLALVTNTLRVWMNMPDE